jgi:ribonuclease PH
MSESKTTKKDKLSLRPIKIIRNFLRDPEGSVLIELGGTRVICTATVLDKVPQWLKGAGLGWIAAEYSMLPRATPERRIRESRVGRPDGRAVEISRIIGRTLRAAVDLKKLAENSIIIDCDVIQADGGTRTACITGGFVALYDAVDFMLEKGLIEEWPIKEFVAAVSVGIVDGEFVLDLSYEEDSRAEIDLNVAMTESGKIVDIQGTGEKRAFSIEELNKMLEIAWKGIKELIRYQKEVLGLEKI